MGIPYRELAEKIEALGREIGKPRVESATWQLVTFEGQMTCNPKPLAQVMLRPDVRKLCWQLLGPPPDHVQTDMIADILARDEKPSEPEQKPEEAPKKKRSRKKAG